MASIGTDRPPFRVAVTALCAGVLAACGGNGSDASALAKLAAVHAAAASVAATAADQRAAAPAASSTPAESAAATGDDLAVPASVLLPPEFTQPADKAKEGEGALVVPKPMPPAPAPPAAPASPTPQELAAGTQGLWSAPEAWPILAIHAVLTPDGMVLTYGSNPSGGQGAQLYYDVWNPVTRAHSLLLQTTGTDIFCGAQVTLPMSGEVLLAGGDIRGRNVLNASGNVIVNRGVEDVNLYSPGTRTLRASGTPMRYARWYDALVPLGDGSVLVLGGTDATGAAVRTPEIYTPGQGWRTLTGVRWPGEISYPRATLAPDGRVIVLSGSSIYAIDIAGTGSVGLVGSLPAPTNWGMPWTVFDQGKLLVLATDGRAMVVDLTGPTPVAGFTADAGPRRIWGTAVVLPDGKVLNTGGSASSNSAANPGYSADLWDPATGQWTVGASAQKYRLYHSTALLLPDATVLTAGGGAPGPGNQLNSEVYSPAYLFAKDGSGRRLPRPIIDAVDPSLRLGTRFSFRAMGTRPIRRVTLVRTGSVTHSTNFEQRFVELPFTLEGSWRVHATLDLNAHAIPPGHYMLFAIDDQGVPSVARIVQVTG